MCYRTHCCHFHLLELSSIMGEDLAHLCHFPSILPRMNTALLSPPALPEGPSSRPTPLLAVCLRESLCRFCGFRKTAVLAARRVVALCMSVGSFWKLETHKRYSYGQSCECHPLPSQEQCVLLPLQRVHRHHVRTKKLYYFMDDFFFPAC